MLCKRVSRIIAAVMLIVAVGFFAFAVTHPTASFPWSNTVTYSLYAVYILITVLLFIAPFKKRYIRHHAGTADDIQK